MFPESESTVLFGGRIDDIRAGAARALLHVVQHAPAQAHKGQDQGDWMPMKMALRKVRTGRCLRFSQTSR